MNLNVTARGNYVKMNSARPDWRIGGDTKLINTCRRLKGKQAAADFLSWERDAISQ